MKKVANMVKCINAIIIPQNSHYLWDIHVFFLKWNIWVLLHQLGHLQRNGCYHMHSPLGEALSHTNLHLKPHDYWINYGNILHGISVTEMYMSLYSSKEWGEMAECSQAYSKGWNNLLKVTLNMVEFLCPFPWAEEPVRWHKHLLSGSSV